ncbi:MAG: hypothetical protein HC869_17260 [Rhodospirillales bacterium]|nr:hypothetical protein [Rhodospirillales bacterium]
MHVLELDSEATEPESHYEPYPLEGQKLPLVEFRKLIAAWAKRGLRTPIVFEYQGKVFASDNITADPTWSPARWDWEMILLDFRVIQPEGPNKCRW